MQFGHVLISLASCLGAPEVPLARVATNTDADTNACDALENNAPRPPAKLGDSETVSEIDILPGADSEHLHGRLGLCKNASCHHFTPVPLPAGGLTVEQTRDAHRGFNFNTRVSDSLPLDRTHRDMRSQSCLSQHNDYPRDLPRASIVVVFHNELYSVLARTAHAILNTSPPQHLKEIMMVDDASVVDADRYPKKRWKEVQKRLTAYCKNLPKVTLVRLRERRGLMLARMEGAWRATGDVLVFLDSHVEPTRGWLEALLARVKQHPTHVVLPTIGSIDSERFSLGGGGISVLSFTWMLGQKALRRQHTSEPSRSPIMAGGLFAADRAFFLHLGGYDPEMRLYGGEEVEMSFRTWMCGGVIEHLPCSHVGHVFRSNKHWQGQAYPVAGDEIARNKRRAAEVWMDEYTWLPRMTLAPLPPGNPVEPLGARKALREKLECKPFEWFLKNVATDVFVPNVTGDSAYGALRLKHGRTCLDTLGGTTAGAEIGAYGCHGQQGTQAFLMDTEGRLRVATTAFELCVIPKKGSVLGLGRCDKSHWGQIEPPFNRLSPTKRPSACVSVVSQASGTLSLKMAECGSDPSGEAWIWETASMD